MDLMNASFRMLGDSSDAGPARVRLFASSEELRQSPTSDRAAASPKIPRRLSHTSGTLRLFQLEDEVKRLTEENTRLEKLVAQLQGERNVTKRKKKKLPDPATMTEIDQFPREGGLTNNDVEGLLTNHSGIIEQGASSIPATIEERLSKLEADMSRVLNPASTLTSSAPATAIEKKRKKRKKKKENAEKKKGVVWGDSIIRKVKVTHLEEEVLKHCRPGVTLKGLSEELSEKVLPDPDVAVALVHAGTNSLKRTGNVGSANAVLVCSEAEELLLKMRNCYPAAKVVLSGIIYRRGFSDEAVNHVNEALERLAAKMGTHFVDPNPWLGDDSLAEDRLHLNGAGATRLSELFTRIFSAYG